MDFGDNSFPNNASDNAFFTDSGKWEVFAGNGCNPTGVGCYINKKEDCPDAVMGICASGDTCAYWSEKVIFSPCLEPCHELLVPVAL